MKLRYFAPLAAVLVSACGSDESGAAAGGMTPAEAQALEDAAEMLDERRLPEDVLSPPARQQVPAKP
jgi:hypothetical protein